MPIGWPKNENFHHVQCACYECCRLRSRQLINDAWDGDE